MSVKPLLIIQMGEPPQDIMSRFGGQGRWMIDALNAREPGLMQGMGAQSVSIVHPASGEALPPVESVAGAVITGSWNMVTDLEDWSELTAAWIRQAHACKLPMLGICYGHQLMAHALGGKVDFHPQGRELGCHALQRLADTSGDPLLDQLPAQFNALLSHDQTVLQAPECARVVARSAHDPHQILRYGDHALSVQFHPEFSPALMRACIERRASELASEGVNMQAMLDNIQETLQAGQILTRFARQVLVANRETTACTDQADSTASLPNGLGILPSFDTFGAVVPSA